MFALSVSGGTIKNFFTSKQDIEDGENTIFLY